MLILLPLAVFFATFLLFLDRTNRPEAAPADWRTAFLKAAVAWGILITLLSEALSLVRAITQFWLAAAWGSLLVILAWLIFRRGLMGPAFAAFRQKLASLGTIEKVVVGGFAAVALVLLAIGWISPPNTVDSLLYHMARVVHWAQNHSLEHYATAYPHQLHKPIWAETAILHLRLLWGNDRPAALVQWISMLGSVIGVSGIAALLGAGRRGQFLASAFAISVPMGILQASSTQNDYAATFWVICLAYFVVLSRRRGLSTVEMLALSGTFGIGLLTKGTFYVYCAPFLLWYFVPRVLRERPLRGLVEGLVLIAFAFVLNLGFWLRNISTFGGPFGTEDWLLANLTLDSLPQLPIPGNDPSSSLPGASADRLPSEIDQLVQDVGRHPGLASLSRSRVSMAGLIPLRLDEEGESIGERVMWAVRRVASLAALNLVTPSSAVNQIVYRLLAKFPSLFRPDIATEMAEVAWSHEDTASNPLHLMLVPLTILGLALKRRHAPVRLAARYGLVALFSYSLVALVIGHGTTVWGLRYQLAFFIAWAPAAGVGLDLPFKSRLPYLYCILLLFSSLPWLLLNNTRPLIGMPPWPTRIGSILTVPPEEVLTAISPEGRPAFVATAATVKNSQCKNVGLRLDSSDLEYVYWWLLDAPQSGYELETVYTFPELERYIDWEPKPCVIICTLCQDRTRLHGLPFKTDHGGISIFIGDGFTMSEDG